MISGARSLFAVSIACAVVSVSGGKIAAQNPQVRDSAGVRIIETGSRAKAPVVFALGAPTLDLGGLKQNPDDEFSRFGVLRNLRFSDGSIVAADEGKLRFYDATGKQVKVVGRTGQGPGEFTRLGSICITRGDTLVAGDDANRRNTILDRTGRTVREFPMARGDLLPHSCFDDGTTLAHMTVRDAPPGANTPYVRYRLDGTAVDTIMLPGATQRYNIYAYAQKTVVVRGNRIYVADPSLSEVKILDPQGKLVSIIRTNDPVEKVTTAQAEAMRPMAVGAGPGARNPQLPPKPTEWPRFRGVDVDESGRIWIEDYPKMPGDSLMWTAIDASGTILGKFRFPAQAKVGDPRVRFFVRDGVLIRTQDSDGAEHLITYRLVRR